VRRGVITGIEIEKDKEEIAKNTQLSMDSNKVFTQKSGMFKREIDF